MKKPFRAAYFLALALTGCATAPDPRETYAPRAIIAEPPIEITIHTSPPGGIVDWNGNVLGAAPVTLKIRPDRMATGRPRWPETGALTHYFRARWPNGARAVEMFQPSEMPPQHIAIVCPGAVNPLLDSLRADARTLTQKKTR
ncbi:MAG: hypothetical protein ACO3GP_01185 [Candidatus Limnocylindrus sp.]